MMHMRSFAILSQSWSGFTLFFLLLVRVCSVQGNPFYDFRSQSVNLARDVAGRQLFMADCGDGSMRGFMTLTPAYTQSFRGDKIAACLFGNTVNTDCTPGVIRVQGSLVDRRDPLAWLADYFGLPTDFDGSLFVNPQIKTFLLDFGGYVALDNLLQGLYVWVHAPLVCTQWDLNLCERSSKGVAGYPAGYFNAIATGTEQAYRGADNNELLSCALDFLGRKQVPNLGPDTRMHPLCCSRLSNADHARKKIGIADLLATVGWNFVCAPDYHMGITLHLSAPAGNKPDPDFLFDPIIGSGGHWKLGAGAHMHVALWRNEQDTAELGFYLDGYGQHLFNATQKRCFDLCGKQNSRYMLASRLGSEQATPSLVAPCNTGLSFQNEYAPVAFLTATQVNVSVAVEGDFVATLVHRYKGANFTLGYNYWVRTCDRIYQKNRCCPLRLESERWALKGDAQMIGFEEFTNNPVRLAATESNATITTGTNLFTDSTSRANNGIDHPCAAMTEAENVVDLPNSVSETKSSNPPVLLTYSDVNFSGTQGSSNKIFAHIEYAWDWCDKLSGHLGIGGEVEFTNQDLCQDDCNVGCKKVCNGCAKPGSCEFCALNQWGLWIKGSIQFD